MNEKKQAVIHLATELNKVAVLEGMQQYKDKIDTAQGGVHGRTALHIAAIYDHDECAKVLVSCSILSNNNISSYVETIIPLLLSPISFYYVGLFHKQ